MAKNRNEGGLQSGRYRDRTDDLYRVKVALIPTELSALRDSKTIGWFSGAVKRGDWYLVRVPVLFLEVLPVAALFDVYC